VTAADGRPRSFGRVGDSARRRGAPDSGKRLLAYCCEVAVVRPSAEHAPMEKYHMDFEGNNLRETHDGEGAPGEVNGGMGQARKYRDEPL